MSGDYHLKVPKKTVILITLLGDLGLIRDFWGNFHS